MSIAVLLAENGRLRSALAEIATYGGDQGQIARKALEDVSVIQAQAPSQPPQPRAYTIDQAADLLAVSRTQIYRLLRASKLRAIRVGGRLRIPEAELQRLLSVEEAA